MLYSKLNILITTFRYSQSTEEPSLPTSISDPTELRLPESLFNATKTRAIISAISLERIQFEEDYRFQGNGPGPGSGYMNNDVRFYGLTIALGNHSTHEALIYSLNSELEAQRDSSNNQVTIEIPSWHKKSSSAQHTYRSTAKVADVGFIVPDGAADEPGNDSLRARLLLRPSQYFKALSSISKMRGNGDNDPWTVDNEFSYQEITEPGADEDADQEKSEEVISVYERINTKLNEAAIQEEPLSTL
jgi:RNA polymerase I-specific transcription initiation factor RRN6